MDAITIRVGLFVFYIIFCFVVLVVNVRCMMNRAKHNSKVIYINRQRGFSLLELLIVCAIILIIVSISMPNAAAMIRAWNNKQAYQRISTVSNAVAALAICNAAHQSCPGVAPLIPYQGTMQTTTYTYIYNANYWDQGSWWSYVAIPIDPTGRSFYVDATGIVRYKDGGTADWNSPVYQ